MTSPEPAGTPPQTPPSAPATAAPRPALPPTAVPGPDRVPTTTLDTVDPDAVLLDVREPAEFAAGHAPGALLIPLGQLADRLGEVPAGQVVVTCKRGGRASRATTALIAAGRDAVNLRGGMQAWSDAGRPMVSDTGSKPTIL